MHKDIRACLPNQDALQYMQGLVSRCICVCIVDRINASALGKMQSAADLQRVVI